ncbi:endonuclease/exonuclease/phosphatase family protein [Wenzhouxiangella marina]|uniref:Endonuclease/exonuclease/phosphatase domain-containing protein n=1 Tax=Wenzhouxiangella marina TaxID=1579979 RepID=A0A0K0XS26_9GAMM|nr:endonuclease/exonuclease/phosphatase family protein [Wenzhouxiangella marina]AKS40426.1 hypothetical protein WM2015_35 [Wenzhouxiangella marina]MBB6088252.1 hypothetical protein [Wenzhouxiangella marina]
MKTLYRLALGLLLLPAVHAADPLSIAEIHGDGVEPRFVDEQVTTEGIVTLVLPRQFWIQTPSESPSSTRDGLEVFTGDPAAVNVGDRVRVTGFVNRFRRPDREKDLMVTRLIQPEIEVLARGQALPAAIPLGQAGWQVPDNLADENPSVDPTASAIDFWTHYSGMRMVVGEHRVIQATNRFGDTWVLPATEHPRLNELGVLAASPDDLDLERILITANPRLQPEDAPPALPGSHFTRIDGVANYAFGQFRVTTRHALEPVEVAIEIRDTRLHRGPEHLTVASYNVENLDPLIESIERVNGERDIDDDIGSGRMARLGEHIAILLAGPDIVALQEIQDNNGAEQGDVLSADRTLTALIEAVRAAGGPDYAFIDLPPPAPDAFGGQPGGNIRNAFLYNPARVELLPPGPRQIDDPAFAGSRAPLLAGFEFNGHRLMLINNHFSSKWGSSPQFGEQPQIIGGEAERPAQADALRRLLDAENAWGGEAHWIVLGDLNDHWFSEALSHLKAEDSVQPLINLIETLPEADRWTYLFSGNAQAIDHLLVTPELAERAEFEILHPNARFPDQAADHEPLLGRFHLPPAAER